MATALDGSAHGNTGSSATQVVALTTANADDVIVVTVLANGGPITGVISAGGLVAGWAMRSRHNPSGTQYIEEWRGVAAGPLTANNITVTQTSADFITVDAFGVSGADTSTIYDSNVSLPGTGAAPLSISTSNANDFIIGTFIGNAATPTNGAGFTTISGADFLLTEYKIVSVTQSGLSVSGTSVTAGISDAIMQVSPIGPSATPATGMFCLP